jgi:DNA primase
VNAGPGAIERVRAAVPLAEVAAERVALATAGRALKGLCPFHAEQTPSFYVYLESGRFHCFGCQNSGDVFTFVMLAENLDFGQALRRLADRAGIPLVAPRADDPNARLLAANAAASELFRTWLADAAGAAARTYLAGRGLGAEAIAAYGVGWAPDGWDTLVRALGERDFAPAELAAAGLAIAREDGRVHDRFRGRVVFPIRDGDGRVVGFGGRLLGEGQPKYLNSAESPLFSKRACLFGLDLARAAIRRERCAVVVEGYVDAIACRQAGLEHVVATMGTAVSAEQLAQLKRLAPRAVLALDPDAAGDAAALRALEALRATRGRVAVPVPDRRGLVRLRYDQELDVRVARLPPGLDPDEAARADPDGFRALIAAARPLIEVLIDAEIGRAGADVHARGAAADTVLEVLAELPNPVVADGFARLLADRLGADRGALGGRLAAFRRAVRGTARRPGPDAEHDQEPAVGGDWLTLEQFVVRLHLLHPTAIDAATAEDFTRAEARALVDGLRLAVAGGAADTGAILDALEAPLRDEARRLLAWGVDLPEAAVEVAEVAAAVRQLRLLNRHRELALIGARRADLDRAGDRAAWTEDAARVGTLLGEIRALERDGGPGGMRWFGALKAEAPIAPRRPAV